MTRTVADAALTLSVIAGLDPNDATSLDASLDDYGAAAKSGAFSVSVGFDEKYVARASNEVAAAVGNALRDLERVGARIVKVKVPDVDPVIESWTTMAAAEALAAHTENYPSRAAEYGPGFRSFVELGAKISGREYADANMVRARFANRFQQLFSQIDVLACPSMVARTLPRESMPPDANAFRGPNPLMSFTAPFNMSRNPTLSMPCGDGAGGPPPSLQLVGRLLGEATLFRVGGAYERATEWHKQRPTI